MPKQRLRCVYYTFTFVVIMTVMNVTKLSYADPRPYWSSENVMAYKCSQDFGNPSGHSMTSMCVCMLLWLDYVYSNPESSGLRKTLLFIAAMCFALAIGYSRLILGVHSVDQIVYGLLIGVWIACTMQFCVRYYYENHVKNLLQNRQRDFTTCLVASTIFFAVVIFG